MVIHSCQNFNRTFNKKSTYINHVKNKKKLCKSSDSNLENIFLNPAKTLTNPAKSITTMIIY
jgi:hypothetical protein